MTENDRPIPRPNEPIRSSELPWQDFTGLSPRFGARLRPLADHGGATAMGFSIWELPPGRQSCPFHSHRIEEEHFFVLEGRCVLRTGKAGEEDKRRDMAAGDYVCFPADTGVAHAFLNPFAEPCRLIVAGTPRRDRNEVCIYPDSGKALSESCANAR